MNKTCFWNTAIVTVGRVKPILSLAVRQLQLCFGFWQRATFLCTHCTLSHWMTNEPPSSLNKQRKQIGRAANQLKEDRTAYLRLVPNDYAATSYRFGESFRFFKQTDTAVTVASRARACLHQAAPNDTQNHEHQVWQRLEILKNTQVIYETSSDLTKEKNIFYEEWHRNGTRLSQMI